MGKIEKMAFTANLLQIFGQKFYRNILDDLGHMTKMAAAPIYGKKTLKNLFLQNQWADCNEI